MRNSHIREQLNTLRDATLREEAFSIERSGIYAPQLPSVQTARPNPWDGVMMILDQLIAQGIID